MVQFVDGVGQVRRPEVDGGETRKGIEGAVEVAHDELALVAHDSTCDCVQKQRYCELREQGMGAASRHVGER